MWGREGDQTTMKWSSAPLEGDSQLTLVVESPLVLLAQAYKLRVEDPSVPSALRGRSLRIWSPSLVVRAVRR